MPDHRPILIAYDGSREAVNAIQHAGRLLPGARAVLLHVHVPVGPAVPTAAGLGAPGWPAETAGPARSGREHAMQVVLDGCEAASAAGLDPEPTVAEDSGTRGIAASICEAADHHDAAVIVVGAHGHSRVLAALLGSVSDAVVHRAHRPVLVVPPIAAG